MFPASELRGSAKRASMPTLPAMGVRLQSAAIHEQLQGMQPACTPKERLQRKIAQYEVAETMTKVTLHASLASPRTSVQGHQPACEPRARYPEKVLKTNPSQ